jgi:tripartite-type tricarboxylate transporter receptor subunit TctC
MTTASTTPCRQITRRTVLGGAAAMIAAPALAQEPDFPSRPLRIIVPYSAGGTSDTAARLVADPLGRHLGQSVVVENRGGAGGLTGTEAYFAMPADGYTLLLGGAGPFAIIPPTRKVSYVVEQDVVSLGTIWRSPQLFAVNPKLGINTMPEFLARARANPGKVLVGSAGIGALTHLSIELLKREAKIDVTHVPYRSTGGTLPALIGGHIDATFGDVSVLATYVRAGTITALAIAAPERSPLLPDLATMAEAGLPGIQAENWFGLVVNSRTPAPAVARLRAAMLATQNDPAYRESLVKQGTSAGEPGVESFDKLIHAEIARWKPIVTAPGFQVQ